MFEMSVGPGPLTTNRKVWLAMVAIMAVLCCIIMTLFYFQELFIVILFGLCLISLMDKTLRIFHKYTAKYNKKQKRMIAASIIISFIIVFGYLIMAQIFNLSSLFADLTNIEIMIAVGTQILTEMLEFLPEMVTDKVHELIDSVSDMFFMYARILLSQAFLYLITIVLIYPVMFSMYFKERENIKQRISDLIPFRFEKEFKHMSSAILTRSNNFFVAKIIESVGVATICCIGFYLIGLPGWLFFGILVGLFNNVPYFGPVISAVPAIFVGLIVGWKVAVLALIVCTIAQLIDNIYFIPFMISSKINVNPFTTVLLILTFSQLYGPLGMILCLPIYVVSKIILIEAYNLLVLIFPEKIEDVEVES
ncbi:MAG: AI-2E family transporter [Methanimicrococcus sp.]|nr:AI-2E family transporter [Methanimicrococcus sp.]